MKNHTLLTVVSVLAVSSAAYAEPRQNTLAADVAVRHRRLLVKRRFEFTPLFESTINADFRHILGGGAKLEYHLSDMWSAGFVGVGSTAINTKLVDKIVGTLPTQAQKDAGIDPMADPLAPSREQFLDRLNTMPVHGAAYASFTPWYGKLAAFGQAYVAFDFYFQAGVSVALLKSNCPATICSDPSPGVKTKDMNGNELPLDDDPNNDPPLNGGSHIGLYLGGGIHVFLNDFLALDMTVRDYAFTDNPSGADFDANRFVSKADNRFLHHLFFGAGISVMLPTTVKRTP